MAGGAYLSAKKGAIEWVSKQRCKSSGVVSWIEGGPSKPEEQTQISRRPKALRTSSMRVTVSSSLAMLKGYGINLVFGWSLDTVAVRVW